MSLLGLLTEPWVRGYRQEVGDLKAATGVRRPAGMRASPWLRR